MIEYRSWARERHRIYINTMIEQAVFGSAEPTKTELRDMLREAVQNTAKLERRSRRKGRAQ